LEDKIGIKEKGKNQTMEPLLPLLLGIDVKVILCGYIISRYGAMYLYEKILLLN
jgi:hypothetical protein